MMLIDKYMPTFHQREFHSRLVSASPPACHAEIRKVDWSGSLTSFLYKSGSRIINLFSPKSAPATDMDLKAFESAGFWILEDNREDEIVIGSYQRFSGKVDVAAIPTAGEFIAFKEPGIYKIAWSIGVGPAGDKSRIHTETRVQCTDEATRRRFAVYWFFISRFSALTRVDFLRSIAKKCEGQGSRGSAMRETGTRI